MRRVADLHSHTIHSDGVDTPEQLVDKAVEAGIGILAISDHDNLAAISIVADYAAERGVTLIPATELSCQFEGVDVHILAYCVDLGHRELQDRLDSFRNTRAARGTQIVEQLAAHGVEISIDRVRQLAGEGAMGRPHVARTLIEAGYSASIGDAFRDYLRWGKPGWVDKERFQVEDAVAIVHDAGGVTSIAHPSLYPGHRRIVPRLFDAGVDGIETRHPDVGGDDKHHYERMAADRGKITTGGSDDHGQNGRKTIGTIRVPESIVDPIIERVS